MNALSPVPITNSLKKKKVTMRNHFLFLFLTGIIVTPTFPLNLFSPKTHITLSSNTSEHSTSFQNISSSSQGFYKPESVFYCPLLEDGTSYRPSIRLQEQEEKMAALSIIHSTTIYLSPAS